jgi:hypothetical protein
MEENCHIPLLSLVSIAIARGSIAVVENDDEYYDLYACPSSISHISCHHAHRRRLFYPNDSPVFHTTSTEILVNVEVGTLNIEFSHRHYLAGNGVDVSAQMFVITAPAVDTDLDASSRVLFAPRTHPLLSKTPQDSGHTEAVPHIR